MYIEQIVTVLAMSAGTVFLTIACFILAKYAPRAIIIWETWTRIMVIEQGRQTTLSEARTSAGILETMIAQGSLKWIDLQIDNPTIIEQAQRALARAPKAVVIEKDQQSMAETIVGMVRTNSVLPTMVGNALAASRNDSDDGDAAMLNKFAIPLVAAGPS